MTADWMADAACLGEDPELFFAEGKGGTPKDWEPAREICKACPVRAQCLESAIETRDEHAMLGGLTPEERKPLLPRLPPTISMRLPIAHATEGGAKQHERRGEKPCTACKRARNIARLVREARTQETA